MSKKLVVAALAGALSLSAPASAETWRIMTGPQGGIWVPLGGQLKQMIEKSIPGVTVQALPGAGIANVRGVDEGKAEIGFGNSISTVDGLAGVEPFKQKATNICQLATLYPQYFQVVVLADAGINRLEDLKGKRIAVQTRGNTAEVISQHIMQAHGFGYKDMGKVNFMASYTDAVSLLKDGHAEAFTLGTTIPASAVMDLASARDVKLLPITDHGIAAMKKINPGYTKVGIPAGTYPKQAGEIAAIGYATHLFASCKLPAEQVYSFVKQIVAHIPDMSAINKDIASLTPKRMAEDIGVPFHPGATRFYKEVGAL